MSRLLKAFRRWVGKPELVIPNTGGLLALKDYVRYEHSVRRLHLLPLEPPDFRALAEVIREAPDRGTGENLLMEMVALVQREIIVARETGYALGKAHIEEEKRDAAAGRSARVTWWEGNC